MTTVLTALGGADDHVSGVGDPTAVDVARVSTDSAAAAATLDDGHVENARGGGGVHEGSGKDDQGDERGLHDNNVVVGWLGEVVRLIGRMQ